MGSGIHSQCVAAEFAGHAAEEHAEDVATLLGELGRKGEPARLR